MRTYISLSLLLALLYSCKKEESEIIDITLDPDIYINEKSFFERMRFNDTITCFIMLDKCGEWGGPQEYYKIYQTHKDSIYLKYYWFDLNCDSTYKWQDSTMFTEKPPILLNQKDKTYLTDLFLLVMKGKITEESGSNAGDYVHLFSKDSTLNVHFVSDNNLFERDYREIKKKLFKE